MVVIGGAAQDGVYARRKGTHWAGLRSEVITMLDHFGDVDASPARSCVVHGCGPWRFLPGVLSECGN